MTYCDIEGTVRSILENLVSKLIFIYQFYVRLINSNILTPLNKFWTKFGILLGKIVEQIVMYFYILDNLSIQ